MEDEAKNRNVTQRECDLRHESVDALKGAVDNYGRQIDDMRTEFSNKLTEISNNLASLSTWSQNHKHSHGSGWTKSQTLILGGALLVATLSAIFTGFAAFR